MGLLPQIADGVGVTIPQAGHLISAYALGVVVGAPLLAALGAKLPRRGLLVGLIAAFGLLNLLSAAMSHYGLLAFVRFLDGLPHGAYFGVAALTAAGMVAPERRGRALALVMMGIPVAMVNWLIGSNYMYLCTKPGVDSPFLVGDWPWYLLGLEVVALLLMAIASVPMIYLRRKGQAGQILNSKN